MDDQESELDRRIRERTFSGIPCGDEHFVEAAERALGRQLARKKPGRPKSKPANSETEAMLCTSEEIRK